MRRIARLARALRLIGLAAAGLGLAGAGRAQMPLPREHGAPASAPALAPRDGTRALSPGLALDPARGELLIDGWICLTAGPLEYVACQSGKEHESVVRLRPSAADVRRGLLQLGARPGRPPRWNVELGEFDAPEGDLLDVEVEILRDGGGGVQRVSVWEWLVELEYQRAPRARPWLFAGSRNVGRKLGADRSGGVVALVDDPDTLLALLGRRSEAAEEAWVAVNPSRAPAVGTSVRLVVSHSRPRAASWALDTRGDLRVDGRWCSPRDAAELLQLERIAGRESVELMVAPGALRADEDRLRRWLRELELAAFVRVVRSQTTP